MARRTRPFASEKEFQLAVEDLCDVFRVRHYHTWDSRRSIAGFPDLVLVGTEVVFAELKMEKGRISMAQQRWLHDLRTAGMRAHVWRPDDWVSGRILAEVRAISPRRRRAAGR